MDATLVVIMTLFMIAIFVTSCDQDPLSPA